MSKAARSSQTLRPVTRKENLDYLSRMLTELQTRAAEVDGLLGYLVDMSRAHALALLSGRSKANPEL